MNTPPTLIQITQQMVLGSFAFDMARYLVAASLVAGVVWLLRRTSWASRKIQRREANRADLVREVLAAVRTVVVYTAMSVPTVWAFRHGYLAEYRGALSPLAFAGYLTAILLAHDTWFYWTHRAMHTKPLYRAFHRFHHLTITPTAWTAYSFAIPEAAMMFLFMPVWFSLVATPVPVIFTFLAVMILRNAMGHAGLELHPRGWARHPLLRWISTTTHHDMHHGTSYNHNYGFYFTWWDKLMGTEHPDYVKTFDRVTTAARAVENLPAPAATSA
ncbi:MAG: sterol desaturase family protein [Novosphingobium sp.]|uniref:sterol desaturase family protein n=1 Tax=Novosphingobium sp. TaxID=1874826 RepID=UPI0032B8EEA2